ncbi:MAG: PEP-CTERM sorting domain-containing protein [Syntrophobacteraceae bacterium]|nr:PEP-CTERM sorting domain-containing protein [Desulfobacteraceae bacterium]
MSKEKSSRSVLLNVFLAAAFLIFFSCPAGATPISLMDDDDATFRNAGRGSIARWLNQLIEDYNTENHQALPTDVSSVFRVEPRTDAPSGYPSFGSRTLSIDIPANYNYLVLHWGGNKGENYEAYDLIGLSGTMTFSNPKYGLSWYEFFGSPNTTSAVPEPATLLLIGSGLAGLVIFRRQSQKAYPASHRD